MNDVPPPSTFDHGLTDGWMVAGSMYLKTAVVIVRLLVLISGVRLDEDARMYTVREDCRNSAGNCCFPHLMVVAIDGERDRRQLRSDARMSMRVRD